MKKHECDPLHKQHRAQQYGDQQLVTATGFVAMANCIPSRSEGDYEKHNN
jgi:hypothetical protein